MSFGQFRITTRNHNAESTACFNQRCPLLNRRRLSLESLEARQMMAGNVTVNVVQGLLKIVGDGAANSVVVESVAGGYRVRGTPFNGAFAADGTPLAGVAVTRINGDNAAIVKAASDSFSKL